MVGIYKITNQLNGKVYIGQSVDIEHRWNCHKSDAKNKRFKTPICRALQKYGINNFIFEILELCPQEELNNKEIFWIKYYNSTNRDNGYNIKTGGEGAGSIYNYQEIYKLWNSGYLCKEIMKEFNCGDQTVTKALRAFGVSEEEIKKRSQNKNAYVALTKDKKPLKIFYGRKQISLFFTKVESKAEAINKRIKNHTKMFGYYWDYLNENNYPEKELSDEEFLSYQEKIEPLSKEQKEKISETQRIVERPSREILKELIRTKSFLEIGRMYNVSDNAIRKWCDFENLPRKKREIKVYSDEEWALI